MSDVHHTDKDCKVIGCRKCSIKYEHPLASYERKYAALLAKYERVLQMLEEASKRSSYQWSEGPDYFPSDYANEGRVALALEILAQIESLK